MMNDNRNKAILIVILGLVPRISGNLRVLKGTSRLFQNFYSLDLEAKEQGRKGLRLSLRRNKDRLMSERKKLYVLSLFFFLQ